MALNFLGFTRNSREYKSIPIIEGMLRISNARVRTPLKYYSSGLGWPEFGYFELKRPQECEELAMPVHNRSFGLQQGGIEFFC